MILGHRRLILGFAVAVSLAAVASASARSHSWMACSGSFNGGFWRDIRERGTTCAAARAVTCAYAQRVQGSPSSFLGVQVNIGTYTCTSRLRQGRDNPYGVVRCFASRGREVTFKGIS